MIDVRKNELDSSQRRGEPERLEPALHLSDYLAILGQHRLLFAAIFLLVFCGLLARALYSQPVFRSEAILQIEREAAGGLLGELQALETSTTEAEIEVMRSHSVALGAFARLKPADFLLEEHAHRPLEVLIASFVGGRAPCSVTVETARLKPGDSQSTYVFQFGIAGDTTSADPLRVERLLNGTRLQVGRRVSVETVTDFRSGAPFQAFDRTFTLHVTGDLAGRRLVLTLRTPEAAALWIQGQVEVREIGRRTGVVSLGFDAESPKLARKVAAALAESYLALKRAHRKEQAQTALEFLKAETARVHDRLQAAEQDLDRQRAESDAVLLSSRAEWIVEKISSLELERAEQKLLLADRKRLQSAVVSEQEIEALLQALDAGSPDPMVLALSDQLARLELQRDGQKEDGMLSSDPRRKRVEAEIRAAGARLQARVRAALNASLRQRIQQVGARIVHLDETIASFEEEARKLPDAERKLTELAREVRAKLQIHGFLVQKEQEAQIALASTLGSARLIDAALEPGQRSSPKLFLQTVLALFLATTAAVTLAFFAEYLDRSIKSPQALAEATGLPLYAAIPAFKTIPGRPLRGMNGSLVTLERPNSMLSEAYRTLRANLRFAGLERPVHTLAITSAVLGEGKTVTTCNLAVACAQDGDNVLLIDADLRRPMTHHHFGGKKSPGLSEVLQGKCEWRDVIRETGVSGLSTVYAGSKSSMPGALLNSPGFVNLINEAREEYGLVLIDVPPALAVADASAFFGRVDGVLLLARYKACRIEVVIDARDQIRRVGGNLLGILFNGFDARKANRRGYGYYGYYGYSGYYGRHGSYGEDAGNGPGKRSKSRKQLSGSVRADQDRPKN